jgi:hypothetical protein
MRKLSILSIAFMSLLVFSAPAFAASDKGGVKAKPSVKAKPCSKKDNKSKLKRCKVQLPAAKPVSTTKPPKPSTEPLPIVETVIESKPIHCLSTNCPPLVDKPIHCLSTKCSCKVQLPVTKPISGTKPAKGSGSTEQVLLPVSESIKESNTCPIKLPVEPVNSYRAQ